MSGPRPWHNLDFTGSYSPSFCPRLSLASYGGAPALVSTKTDMPTPEVPAGLVGLASFFGSCVDAFGGFGLAQGADRETEVALLKLDIEKTRFLIWSENVGILLESRDPRLLDERVVARIWPALCQIKILLTDSVRLRTSYGAHALDTPLRKTIDYVSSHSLAIFREDASRFWSGNASELAAVAEGAGIGRANWTVYEGEKFQGLVGDVGRAVDGLFGLVEVAREIQDRAIIEDIESILNVSHLFIIEEAAAGSYEVYSQAAASARASIAAGTVDCRTADERSDDGPAAERLNALLCDTCDGLFRWHCFNFNPDHANREKSSYYLRCHHETLIAFMEAVDAGCWICWRVFEWLSAEFQQNLRDAALRKLATPASIVSSESSGHSCDLEPSYGSEHAYGSEHSDRSEQSYRSELSEPGDFTVYEAHVTGTDEAKFRIEVSIYLHDREHAPLAGDYVKFCFFPANQKGICISSPRYASACPYLGASADKQATRQLRPLRNPDYLCVCGSPSYRRARDLENYPYLDFRLRLQSPAMHGAAEQPGLASFPPAGDIRAQRQQRRR